MNNLAPTIGTCKYYPYDDDLQVFESLKDPWLARTIVSIKHNDPEVRGLQVHGLNLDRIAWMCIGYILSQSTQVEELVLQNCHPDLAGLFNGLQNNHIITKLWLDGVNLRDADRLSTLAPFLINNTNLKDIVFIGCNIGHGINVLGDALLKRTVGIESINIVYDHFENVDIDSFISALNKNGTRLQSLGLSFNGIGRRGCTSLAKLLNNQKSNVIAILGGNKVPL